MVGSGSPGLAQPGEPGLEWSERRPAVFLDELLQLGDIRTQHGASPSAEASGRRALAALGLHDLKTFELERFSNAPSQKHVGIDQ